MEWIHVTDHAALRWHQRAGDPGIGPLVAWTEAEPADPPGVVGDEIRHHEPTDTYLVRRQSRLVTVLQANIRDPATGGVQA